MNKKVCVTIKGLHQGNKSDEEIEVVSIGTYANKGHKKIVRYEDLNEDGSGIKSTVITFSNHEVEVISKGIICNHMIFTEGKKHVSYYETPFGTMNMSTEAYEVNVEETEKAIHIEIFYGLEINLDYMTDRKVYIDIESVEE